MLGAVVLGARSYIYIYIGLGAVMLGAVMLGGAVMLRASY